MAAAPVWMRRPLHDRTLGPSACKDLRLSPQHNPTQLNPVTGRPLITPVHRAKNNSWGLNLGCYKINMCLWLWACLQLSIFNHGNQNKQRCEADFKSALSDPPFMSSLALFSIIQSHLIGIISALFPVSCLDIWPAALTTTITQRVLLRMYWKSLGRMRAGGGGMADSMTEVRKRMILLLPGKVQQTNPWKKMLFTLADKIFFSRALFEIPAEMFYDKRC